jgi:hypothetical protein
MDYHYYKRAKKGKYKGVFKISNNYKNGSKSYIIAKIIHEGISYYLGSFTTTKRAARAYNEAALRLFGENARLNKVCKIKQSI